MHGLFNRSPEAPRTADLLLRASAVAMIAAIATVAAPWSVLTGEGPAWAQGQGAGNQGSGNQGSGNQDAGNQGSGSQGNGGQGGSANQPNWAGAELTDIGRLNIIKTDERVLDNALYNTDLSFEDYSFYNLTAEEFAAQLTSLDQIVDSPVANMALLDLYWSTGDFVFDHIVRLDDGGTMEVTVDLADEPNDIAPASPEDFSAIVIGIALDKEMEPTVEIVEALANIVWGDEANWPSTFDAAAIADGAALVQDQVVAVHDAQ